MSWLKLTTYSGGLLLIKYREIVAIMGEHDETGLPDGTQIITTQGKFWAKEPDTFILSEMEKYFAEDGYGY